MALSANAPVKEDVGKFNELPVKASTTIYEGAMVGDDGSGYARGLVAGDPFRGHAYEKADNGSGSAGDINVKVYQGRYRLQVAVTGASAVTDVGSAVYASADGTLTLTVGSNTRVGTVIRWVTSTTCIVEFDTRRPSDVDDHEHTGAADGGALTSPVIANPHVTGGIEDAAGNDILDFIAVSDADAAVFLKNNTGVNPPEVGVSGASTHIPLVVKGKGTGAVKLGAAAANTEPQGNLVMAEAKNIGTGTSVGTILAISAGEKLGLYGTTPVVQGAAVGDAGDSTVGSLHAVQQLILARLRAIGLIAT